jgi:hypothetical protein
LDFGCFSSFKTAYRRLLNEHTALTDTTKVGKANFLEFYAKARAIGLREENVRSGWKATGLYPKDVVKPLSSRGVIVSRQPATPPPPTSDISSPKRGGDVLKLFAGKNNSPASRLSIRKAAAALDKVAMEVNMRDREIERLQAQLAQVKPPKRRKIVQDPNERFTSLAQVLAQANQEPQQRIRKARMSISWKGRVAPSRKRRRYQRGGRRATGDQQTAIWSEIRVQTKKAIKALQNAIFFMFVVVKLTKLCCD